MSRGNIVYVGNLPLSVRERELEDLFYKYGHVRHVDLKTPSRPPAFAFVEFDDPRDAADAARGRDGYDFGGYRLRVEISHGGRAAASASGGGGGSSRYGSTYGSSTSGGARGLGPAPYGPSRRTDFRVLVTGLPSSASWQDLKDHMRKGGDVTFAQVMRDGSGMLGMVDYGTRDDMDRALRKLDDSEFRNPYDKAYIRVKEDRRRGSRSPPRRRSPSPRGRSLSRSRSRSRSPVRGGRDVSRSRSRSASPVARSRSRSRSASPAKSRSPAPRARSPARSVSRSRSRSRSKSMDD